MITVEELIVQSLYHRLVVVNVRRAPGTRTDGLGLLMLGAQSVFGASQTSAPNALSIGSSAAAGPAGQPDVEEDDDPDPGDPPDEASPEGASLTVSKDVQTILDTGEIRLIKSTTTCTNTGQEDLPIWFFGSPTASLIPTRPGSMMPLSLEGMESNNDTMSVQQMVNAVDNIGNDENGTVQKIPGIDCPESLDLRNLNQFSILKFTDIRDPTNKSLVMIQGPGDGGSARQQYQERIKAQDKAFLKDREENETNDTEHEPKLEISDEVPLQNMAVFIQRGGPKVEGLPPSICSNPADAITQQAVGLGLGQQAIKGDSSMPGPDSLMDSAANCFGCFRSDSPMHEPQGCFKMSSHKKHDVDSPSRTGLLSEEAMDRTGGAIPKSRPSGMQNDAQNNELAEQNGDNKQDVIEPEITFASESLTEGYQGPTIAVDTNVVEGEEPPHEEPEEEDEEDDLQNDGLLLQAERPETRPSLDSGIWDVIQGKEGVATSSNSSQESTPMLIQSTGAPTVMANAPTTCSAVTSPTQATPEKSLVTYKAYLIDEDLQTAVLERAKVTSTTKFLETPEKQGAIAEPKDTSNNAVRPNDLKPFNKKALAVASTPSSADDNAFEDAVDYQIEHEYTSEMAYENEGETGVFRFRQSRRSSLVNTPESGSNGTNTPLYERREDREAIFKVIHDIKKISVLQRTPEDCENMSLALAVPLPQESENEQEELSSDINRSGDELHSEDFVDGSRLPSITLTNMDSVGVKGHRALAQALSSESYTESDMHTCVESPDDTTDGMVTCVESQEGDTEMETCREEQTDTCDAEAETSDGYMTAAQGYAYDRRRYIEDHNKRDSWGDPIYRMLPLNADHRAGANRKRRPPPPLHHRYQPPRQLDTDKTPTNDASDVGNTTSEYSTLTNSSTIESIESESRLQLTDATVKQHKPAKKAHSPRLPSSSSNKHRTKKAGKRSSKSQSRSGSASATGGHSAKEEESCEKDGSNKGVKMEALDKDKEMNVCVAVDAAVVIDPATKESGSSQPCSSSSNGIQSNEQNNRRTEPLSPPGSLPINAKTQLQPTTNDKPKKLSPAIREERKSLILPLDNAPPAPTIVHAIPRGPNVAMAGPAVVIAAAAGPASAEMPLTENEKLDSPTNYEREHNAHYYRTTKPRRPPVAVIPKAVPVVEDPLLAAKDKSKRKGGIMDKMKGMAGSLSEKIQGFAGQKSPRMAKSPKFFRKSKSGKKKEDDVINSTKSLESNTDSMKTASIHSTESEAEVKKLQEEIERKYSIKSTASPLLPNASTNEPHEGSAVSSSAPLYSYDPADFLVSTEVPPVQVSPSIAAVHECAPPPRHPAVVLTTQTAASMSTVRDFSGQPITVMIPPPSTTSSSHRGSHSRLVTIVGDYSPVDVAPVHHSIVDNTAAASALFAQASTYVVPSQTSSPRIPPLYVSHSSAPAGMAAALPGYVVPGVSPVYLRQSSAPVDGSGFVVQSAAPGFVVQSVAVPDVARAHSPIFTSASTQALPPVHSSSPSILAHTPFPSVDQPVPSFDKPVYISPVAVPTPVIQSSPQSIRKMSLPRTQLPAAKEDEKQPHSPQRRISSASTTSVTSDLHSPGSGKGQVPASPGSPRLGHRVPFMGMQARGPLAKMRGGRSPQRVPPPKPPRAQHIAGDGGAEMAAVGMNLISSMFPQQTAKNQTEAPKQEHHVGMNAINSLCPELSRHSPRDSGMGDHDDSISERMSPGIRTVDTSEEEDSTFYWDDSDESMASIASLPLDLPEYDKFPDWMAQLPTKLQEAPLADLAIPGSHISLAIEQDMRSDMDFSKCNYEMADFMRKLPDLAIFNNFRGLMKKIWKAWMPKQALPVPQQLEAGVRFLDLRVTKYRQTLYAEHGLYTKQLAKYLKDVKDYLDHHPREVVLLHFQALNQIEKKDKRRLVTSLFQVFGAKMAKVATLETVSLKSLWSTRKQVIIIFPKEDMDILGNHIFSVLIWPDSIINTRNAKIQQVSELESHLEHMYIADRGGKIHRNQLHLSKAVLSPDTTMVFGDYQYKSMRELAANETNLMACLFVEGKVHLNIVVCDFVGVTDVVARVIRLNYVKNRTEGAVFYKAA